MTCSVLTRRNQTFAITGFSESANQIISFQCHCFVSFFSETHPMHKTPSHPSSSALSTIIGKDLSPDQRLNFWNSTAESTSSKLNFPPISLLLLLRTFFTVLPLPLLSGWTRQACEGGLKGGEDTSQDDEGIKTRLLNQETTKRGRRSEIGYGRGACKSLERSEGLGKSIAAASEQGGEGGQFRCRKTKREETGKGKKEVLRG